MCECPSCGAKLNIKAASWLAKSSTQTFKGPDANSLTQTYPMDKVRTRSATYTRIIQATACAGAFAASGFAAFVSPLPLLVDATVIVGAGVFIASVALGKDNQDLLVKIFDRNDDGKVDLDDLHTTIDELRDKLDDALAHPDVPVHEPGPDITVNSGNDTRQIPGPEPYIARSLIIRAKAIDQPALVVELDELCAFIRGAVGLGEWTRSFWTSKAREEYKLSADTWQAYQNFFSRSDVALWRIDPPTSELPGIIVQFRRWATDQPETD